MSSFKTFQTVSEKHVMLVLGVESSCDETGCAIVKDGTKVLSDIVASQIVHEKFGGVVPELASRAHTRVFPEVLKKSLNDADVSLKEIDAIAVSETPGLIGSLSVGINFAKGLATGLKKPLVGVNHVEAHLYAGYMFDPKQAKFPALGIALSGAHTSLFIMTSPTDFFLLGQTLDDAIGETFDKVAGILGFPYPGGPFVERAALKGNCNAFPFKSGKVDGYDFSFSGLKTAVLYAVKGKNSDKSSPSILNSDKDIADLASSFQKAAFLNIVKKSFEIVKRFSCGSIIVGGGVCANDYFRKELVQSVKVPVLFPPKELCSDNAAMIAALGTERLKIESKELRIIRPCPRAQWQNFDISGQ
ncbi:MAG: tRNA (adenosine(37)-N6)-threonylcarbamoyltransferase complex transferase subunit TsaD [Victivallaceae bacterium]